MAEPIEGAPAPDAAEPTSEASLIEMAAKLDAGEGSPQIEGQIAPEIKTTDPKPGDAPPPEEKTGEEKKPVARERGPDGKFLPAKKDEEAPPIADEPAKPAIAVVDSEYEKAKKERARQESLLKNFDQEKRQVREQAEALRKREAELANVAAQQRPEATLHGYTAREYYKAVEDFTKAGDHENALKSMQAFNQLRAFEYQHSQEQNAKATDARFNAQMNKVLEEHEELRNPDSPEAQAVVSVLTEYPEVYYLDNGFAKAHKLALQLLKSKSAEEFETKLKAAEEELTKLRAATTPSAGGPSTPVGTKTFNQMSPSEQEAHLERTAHEMDQVAA